MKERATSTASALQTPSLPRRMVCFVYEGLILFGIGLIPGAIGAVFFAQTHQEHPLQSAVALQVITFVIYAVYFSWLWSKRGQTLPMQTWHIRVVTIKGGSLTQAHALARFIASCLWVAPAALVAELAQWSRWETIAAVGTGIVAYSLLALLHPQRQFWHDAICGTRLITVHPEPRPHA